MYRIARRSRRDDKALASEVRKLARLHKLSADALAATLGISTAEAQIFFQTKKPPRALLTRAAAALGIDTTPFCEGSSNYYISFVDHLGISRRIPATSDERSSREYARRLELIVNARRAGSALPPDLVNWADCLQAEDAQRLIALDLLDSATLPAVTPIKTHVEAWVENMKRDGRTAKHYEECQRRVLRLLEAGGIKNWPALSVTRIQTALDAIKTKGGSTLSIQNRNKYIAAAKAFASFMVRSERAQYNPVQRLRKSRVTAMHRRALSRDEVPWLLEAARKGEPIQNRRWSGTGEDRYLVYLVELHTGLRAAALGGLCVRDFRLDEPTPHISVPAALEKNRTENRIPLPPQVVVELKRAFALKTAKAKALNCPRPGDTAWMVRHDLAVAKAAYVKAGATPEDRAKRGADGFLTAETAGKMRFDFHSLRVTTATLLQEAGVPIGFVQRILNHKSLAMTLDNYNQPGLETLHRLIAVAPTISTGTHGSP